MNVNQEQLIIFKTVIECGSFPQRRGNWEKCHLQ